MSVQLLSICIPTYNRAHLLKAALGSIAPQIAASQGAAELVISDNCSEDDTQALIKQFSGQCPIRYERNSHNLGPIANIFRAGVDLPKGEFVWMLGDDEMLRPGAVAAVLEILGSKQSFDYVYVNYSIDPYSKRDGKDVSPADFEAITRTGSKLTEPHVVQRWEELIQEDLVFLTAIYCTVVRRSIWQAAVRKHYKEAPAFSNVMNTWPHTAILANALVGRPAFATGYPWVIMCGTESWAKHVPVVVLLRVPELFKFYSGLGIAEELLDTHRRNALTASASFIEAGLQLSPPLGLEKFTLGSFLLNNWRYIEAWRAARDALTSAQASGTQLSITLRLLSTVLERSTAIVSLFKKRGVA